MNKMVKAGFCLLFVVALAACQKQLSSDVFADSTQKGSPHSGGNSVLPAPLYESVPTPVHPKKNASWVRYPKEQPLSQQAQLGKMIFFDVSLSASGKMSCATCHHPDHAYAPDNDLAVQLGGEKLNQPGTRAVPSLRYLTFTPLFTRHYYLPSPEGVEDEGPAGGFTQDGAVNSLHEQASIPLLSANEMANVDAATVTQKIKASNYAKQFAQVYGEQIFSDAKKTLAQVGNALEAFQMEDASFHPYTSKFDAVVSGNAAFTDAELRGYRVFKDSSKGNCAKCHLDSVGAGGKPAQFTDFAYEALGVPRNSAILANRSANYADMGLCGPFRKDMMKETKYCGMFKTPTLRNVATRKVFFHNGYFRHLDDAMHFYVERDSQPQKWYSKKNRKVQIYDDLPKQYHDNIDHVNAPFDRKKGAPAALNDAEIKDLVVFLGTLNDGYSKTAGGE